MTQKLGWKVGTGKGCESVICSQSKAGKFRMK
jgi:hypothetical protein